MATKTSKGIVLQSADFEDTSKIVTIFTEDFGLVPMIARGANKATSKNRYGLVSYTYGEYIFFGARQPNKLSKLKTAHFLKDHLAITNNYSNYQYIEAITSLILTTMDNWSPNPELFWDLAQALHNFNNDDQSLSTFVRFLFYLIPQAGGPRISQQCGRCANYCPKAEFFSLTEMHWVCQNCQMPLEKTQDEDWLDFMRYLCNNDFRNSQKTNQSIVMMAKLGIALLNYYNISLGTGSKIFSDLARKKIFQKN